MLTCSGDGTAHLIALPPALFDAVAPAHSIQGASGDLDNGHQSEGTLAHPSLSFAVVTFRILPLVLHLSGTNTGAEADSQADGEFGALSMLEYS